MCGVREWGSWPTCQTHYDVTFSDAYDSWYNYVWEASYTPHGPIHSLIGGYTNCETELDQMAVDLSIDNVTAAAIKYKVITFLKVRESVGKGKKHVCVWISGFILRVAAVGGEIPILPM